MKKNMVSHYKRTAYKKKPKLSIEWDKDNLPRFFDAYGNIFDWGEIDDTQVLSVIFNLLAFYQYKKMLAGEF